MNTKRKHTFRFDNAAEKSSDKPLDAKGAANSNRH